MSKAVDPKTLVGEHLLQGVSMQSREVNRDNTYEESGENGIAFMLDGVCYRAWEDPNDGYRSSMGQLEVVTAADDIRLVFELAPMFPKGIPVRVLYKDTMKERDGHHYSHDSCSILEFYDTRNNALILEVGTDNSDDYYPSAVMCWSPEKIAQ